VTVVRFLTRETFVYLPKISAKTQRICYNNLGGSKMYATTGTIQGNTILADTELEKYDGRKVIITVLEDENQFGTISDEKLFSLSDSLIHQNREAYKKLAK